MLKNTLGDHDPALGILYMESYLLAEYGWTDMRNAGKAIARLQPGGAHHSVEGRMRCIR